MTTLSNPNAGATASPEPAAPVLCTQCGALTPPLICSEPAPAHGDASAYTEAQAAEPTHSQQRWLMTEQRQQMLDEINTARADMAQAARKGLISDDTYRLACAELALAAHAVSRWAGCEQAEMPT